MAPAAVSANRRQYTVFTWLRVWWFTSKVRSDDPRTRLAGLQGLARVRSEKYAESKRSQFRAALADQDSSVVVFAVKLLTEISDRGAVERLVRLVPHREEIVSQAARDALDTLDPRWQRSPEGRGMLRAALANGDEPIQLRAIALVRESRDAEHLQELVCLLLNSSAAVQQAARMVLDAVDGNWRSAKATTSALPRFRSALADSNSRLVLQAVELVQDFGDREAVEGLIGLLSHRDESVYLAARGALDVLDTGWKTSPAVLDVLRAVLDEEDEPIQVRAIALVCEGDDNCAIEALTPIVLGTSDSLSQVAASALDELVSDWRSSPTVQKFLEQSLREPVRRKPRVAARLVAFVNSLGTSGLPLAIEALRAGFEDRNADLWFAAKGLLTRIASTATSEMVRLLTDDPHPAIREAAAEALGRTCSNKVVAAEDGMEEAFVNALQDPDRQVRMAAAQAIGDARVTGAIRPLLDALDAHDRDKDFVERAVTALGQLGASAAREQLVRRLETDSWEPTQIATAWALVQTAGKEALPHIQKAATATRVLRLRAFYFELLQQFDPIDGLKGLTAEMLDFRRTYNQWRRRIDTLDQGKLASEMVEVLRQGTPINIVAFLTQARIDLCDGRVDLDNFLHSALKTISSSDVEVIAENWGRGGFWRTR